MLMSVEYLRKFVDTEETDAILEARLEALEIAIRQETHNTFTERFFSHETAIKDGVMLSTNRHISVGDTVLISGMPYGNGIYTVMEESKLNPDPDDTEYAVLHRVIYPPDVVMGCVDIMKYKLSRAAQQADAKAGISSETISRHSVSFAGEDAFSGVFGVPERLVKFLDRYRKARF